MVKISLFEKKYSERLLAYINKVSVQTNNLGLEPEEIKSKFNLEKIQQLTDNLEASVSFIAIDEKSTQILGLAQISRKLRKRYKNHAELAISVDKEYWNQHIGRKLLEACINHAVDKWQIDGIYLAVLADNQRAIYLYQKYGFKMTGNLPILLTINGINKPGKLMFKNLQK